MDRNIAAAFRSSVAAASAAVASPTVSLSPTKAPRQHGHQSNFDMNHQQQQQELSEDEIYQKIQRTFAGINQTYSNHLPSPSVSAMLSGAAMSSDHNHVMGMNDHKHHIQSTPMHQHQNPTTNLAHHSSPNKPTKQQIPALSPVTATTSTIARQKDIDTNALQPAKSRVNPPPGTISTSALSAHEDDDSPVRAQHAPVEISYSKYDIGKIIQMFSFRFNSWENIQLVDFDVTRSLHKCQNQSDGTSQWLDLKKKPIRGIDQGSSNEYEDDE